MSDEQIARVIEAYTLRIQDLKRDSRFKYVAVFENRGALSGAEWDHPYSQVTATMFVPRRILYELRAARTWFAEKERCVFCDILRQEERQGKRMVDTQGEYVAFCPYASRVPFETWIMWRKHNHLFEQPRSGANRMNLAALLGRVLTPLGASFRFLPSGASHRPEHDSAERGAVALLGDDRGRFSLAHRDSSDR